MQDSASGIVGCSGSRVGREIVWKFLQKNWTEFVKRFGEKSHFLVSFVEVRFQSILFFFFIIHLFQYCLSDFADVTTADEIQRFFDAANTPIVSRAVKQVIETIHMRSQVLKRDSQAIGDYLKTY